jgi:hypothetical protein
VSFEPISCVDQLAFRGAKRKVLGPFPELLLANRAVRAFHAREDNTVNRQSRHLYLDPLDAVWLTVARRIGFRVTRSSEVYASTSGDGEMTIGTAETLDPDDCLAQMIFHELCHSLVEGAQSLRVPDFGLDNETSRDTVREHACLRLQAALAGRFGLRQALAPTTDFRSYYDELPADPLASGDDTAIAGARAGAERSEGAPWAPHLQAGLDATARILRVAKELGADSADSEKPPIWQDLDDA